MYVYLQKYIKINYECVLQNKQFIVVHSISDLLHVSSQHIKHNLQVNAKYDQTFFFDSVKSTKSGKYVQTQVDQ